MEAKRMLSEVIDPIADECMKLVRNSERRECTTFYIAMCSLIVVLTVRHSPESQMFVIKSLALIRTA